MFVQDEILNLVVVHHAIMGHHFYSHLKGTKRVNIFKTEITVDTQ